ncbi:MAG: hypothetical protein ABR88_00155 [Cryomorphaceae bacterium BACL7 MAG-120322-bin74]|nr:MAG: hypothetical protein ABR88_00155 [Cryomorphaceae bacterium BACL7 MAG-120322-bin74]
MSKAPLYPSADEVTIFWNENQRVPAFRLRLKRPSSAHLSCLIDQWEVRLEMSDRFGALLKMPGYLFPGRAKLQQASSSATALWKATQLRLLFPDANKMWDVTGGSGIDTWGFEQVGMHCWVTEPNQDLAALHRHNAGILGTDRQVIECTAEAYQPPHAFDLIYADPSRMDLHGQRVYHPADCHPNPLTELDRWLSFAPWILLKLSPMVDPDAALKWFPTCHQLWTLSMKREVKEVLLLIGRKKPATEVQRHAVDVHPDGAENYHFILDQSVSASSLGEPKTYLYDPDAALVAARALPSLAVRFALTPLHPEARLLTSDVLVTDFPGRIFQVVALHPPFQGEWPQGASVVVRGFPEKAETIRKRMKLKENTEHYLIATYWGDNIKGFIQARRMTP